MNLPSSTPTSATAVSAASSTEVCQECGSQDSWVIHPARLRGALSFFCTHCLLRNHPKSFCPSCLAVYDPSPPRHYQRVPCSDCGSYTHIECAGDATSPPYLCPPCRNPTSFSFFRPLVGADGVHRMDKPLSEAFLCAAKISALSMKRAVVVAKLEAELKGRECVAAKKRAREALEDVLKIDEKERAATPKVNEASGDQEQKPKQSLGSGELKKQ
ncbi:hypothetical protein Rs2_36118 [Raphanus sativus]|uniref:Uncharacterized protein LOC108821595 n=1 Tax=Raphanus sativus TaxID=3726 RepID=A0A6J0KQA9_RAPSA|nr:uncharacterized protein LOC108821595 [Raphanus sativus]KAJ4879064.1 hypothetical protein Rs2_36118 [Raphanus sativus]